MISASLLSPNDLITAFTSLLAPNQRILTSLMVKWTLNANNEPVKDNLLGPCGPTNPKRQLFWFGTCHKETKCIPLRVDMNPSTHFFHDTLYIRMILVTHQLVSPIKTWPRNQPIHFSKSAARVGRMYNIDHFHSL